MTSEQRALLDKARASVRAAHVLAEQEGLYDFAVSRAYYAMFYVAQAFLLGQGLTFSKHAAVIAEFGRIFVKASHLPAQFHRYLIEGAASRTVGDYGVGPGLSAEQAAEQIRRAEEFVVLGEQQLGAGPA